MTAKTPRLKSGQLHPDARALARRNYAFTVRPSEEGYEITFPELPGCATYADTLQEALSNIDEAKLVWISGMLKSGQPVPEPKKESDYSGRFLVRCSSSLHKALSEMAALEGVSLNQYIVQVLAEKIGFERASASSRTSAERTAWTDATKRVPGRWDAREEVIRTNSAWGLKRIGRVA